MSQGPAPEPGERYDSPGHLAEDLGRYLDGLPVTARPDTFRYRAAKFIRRNRRTVVSAAMVVVTIMGLVAWDNARLARERDRARLAAARAEQTATFLADIFAQADPEHSRGADITAREILNRGAERIDEQLGDQPEVQAAMLDVLGGVYEGLGSTTRDGICSSDQCASSGGSTGMTTRRRRDPPSCWVGSR